MHSQLWSSPQHKNQMSFFNIDYLCTLTVKDGKYTWPRSLPILITYIYLDIDVIRISVHYIQNVDLSRSLSLFNKTENYFHCENWSRYSKIIYENTPTCIYMYSNETTFTSTWHIIVHIHVLTYRCRVITVYMYRYLQWWLRGQCQSLAPALVPVSRYLGHCWTVHQHLSFVGSIMTTQSGDSHPQK